MKISPAGGGAYNTGRQSGGGWFGTARLIVIHQWNLNRGWLRG